MKIYGILVLTTLVGCVSIQTVFNSEFYVFVDRNYYEDILKKSIKNDKDVMSTTKLLFNTEIAENLSMFCITDKFDKELLQCGIFTHYYNKALCDDITLELNNSGFNLLPDASYETCKRGEYYKYENGYYGGWILKLTGYSVHKKTYFDYDKTLSVLARGLSGYSGNCYLPTDRATDGSRCGKRAATSRPGG